MKTSADNKRVGELITGIKDGSLIPRPEFQRRLVWSNREKLAFLETVLLGYPFPEIYLATGEIDVDTAEGSTMLVDGQQRITTLFQYFEASPLLKLDKKTPPYATMSKEEKTEFLNYRVAVRDLGLLSIEKIKEIFLRINSTSLNLNAMEVNNARFNGPLKKLAEAITKDEFFTEHDTFSPNEIRRMRDVVYVLTMLITMMSTYFHRDDEIDRYLEDYNDEFPQESEMLRRFSQARDFISACNFPANSRAWKKTDLLVLFVEVDRALHDKSLDLDPEVVGPALQVFYNRVDAALQEVSGDEDTQAYFRTTVQATNDRTSRLNRGRAIEKVIGSTV